jgi:large subunit ribosomal protein L21
VFAYTENTFIFVADNFESMNAIVNIQGQQFDVTNGKEIFVHRLPGNVGDAVSFEEVLLTDNDGKVTVGMPTVANAKVNAKILAHVQGEKVAVFKKKRRKGYQKWNNHRQDFTKIVIESIA